VSGLAAFLTDQRTDPATLEHAVRYLVAEWASDPTAEAMREQLAAQAGDRAQLEAQLRGLERDGALLEAASLAVLDAAWEDRALREAARGALLDAKAKLPVDHSALIALVVLYGMYLAVTGGRRSERRSIVRRPDGSYEEETVTEWYGPAGALRALLDALQLPGGATPPQLPEDTDE
jgi:hypothetical protein